MAETTISDLYEKYTNQVGEALEDDRYFQYLLRDGSGRLTIPSSRKTGFSTK